MCLVVDKRICIYCLLRGYIVLGFYVDEMVYSGLKCYLGRCMSERYYKIK